MDNYRVVCVFRERSFNQLSEVNYFRAGHPLAPDQNAPTAKQRTAAVGWKQPHIPRTSPRTEFRQKAVTAQSRTTALFRTGILSLSCAEMHKYTLQTLDFGCISVRMNESTSATMSNSETPLFLDSSPTSGAIVFPNVVGVFGSYHRFPSGNWHQNWHQTVSLSWNWLNFGKGCHCSLGWSRLGVLRS